MKKFFLSLALVGSLAVFGQNNDKNEKAHKVVSQALDLYNAKDYSSAAPKFEEGYNILKEGKKEDKLYLYYAGLSYSLANNNAKAIEIYKGLIASNFTGAETEYTAKNNKTGVVEKYDKTSWDLIKKSKDYSDFKTEKTAGVESELYYNTAILLLQENKADEALPIIERGIVKFPAEQDKFVALKSNAFAKSGNKSALAQNLKTQLAKDPNNAEGWYNLGVILSENPETVKEAEEAYKKAGALKADFPAVWQNLSYLMLGDDTKLRDEMQAAKKAGNTSKYEQLSAQRKTNFNNAIPFAEKWHAADSKNLDAVQLLKQLYISTKNQSKVDEFKAKEAALGGGK